MNQIANCAKFDYRMVMVYKKTYWLFFLVPLLYLFISQNVMNGLYVSGIMAIMMIGYPFSIEEKGRVELRLRSMPVSWKEMVWGRYLYTVLFLALFLLLISAESVLLGAIFGLDIVLWQIFAGYGVSLGVVLLFAALQLPVFYKFGYMKSRIVVFLPFIVLWFAVMILGNYLTSREETPVLLEKIEAVFADPFMVGIVLVVIVLLSLAFSLFLSTGICRKKDM